MDSREIKHEPAAGALKDRVILVTGAGSGIGRAVAERAAALGAGVVLLGRQVPPLEATFDAIVEAGGPEPAIAALDLAEATPENYRELADQLAETFGRLDGVALNAARLEGLAPLRDVSAKEWYQTLQVNLSAPYLLIQALLPLLGESDAGRLVFTLDDPDRMLRAYWGAYGVSKAGLEGLMRIVADELESGPVTACGVRPGPTAGNLRAKAWAAEDPASLTRPADRANTFLALLDPAFEPEAGAIYSA